MQLRTVLLREGNRGPHVHLECRWQSSGESLPNSASARPQGEEPVLSSVGPDSLTLQYDTVIYNVLATIITALEHIWPVSCRSEMPV